MHGTNMTLLMVEDDESDAFLLQKAFLRVDQNATIHIVPDGKEAIAYLKGEGIYSDRTKYAFPRVLITDLKMPRMNGFELLAWLKNHPECNVIPTIVFSASRLPPDVTKAYQLSANAFFQKPTDFDRLVELIELNFRFWRAAEVPLDDPGRKCG